MDGIAVERETVAEELQQLGLERGDTVLVRTALRSIGFNDEKPAIALLQALVDVLGPDVTVVGLAFNIGSWFPRLHKKHVINLKTQPYTGGFAKAMVNWPGSVRSEHPTNSFVALGRAVREIVDGHDENATCFFPMEKLIELEGKMVLIGCVSTSPGFSTVHLVQEKLGIATQSLLKGLQGTYFEKDGEIKLFKCKDFPGCSMGFSKFYSHYICEEKLRVGYVGNAYSILIGARDAFDIEYNILEKNPKFALCDNHSCFVCRGTRCYNKIDMPRFYLVEAPNGFSAGTCFPYKPASVESIVEIPFQLMDSPTIGNPNEYHESFLDYLKKVKKVGGCLALDFHQEYFDEIESPGTNEAYRMILETLSKDQELWVAPLKDVCSHFCSITGEI